MNKQDFKAWDPSDKKMLTIGEFEIYYEEDNGLHSGRFEDDGDYIGFDLIQYSGLYDANKKQAWEGDVRRYKGNMFVLVNHVWQWRLDRSMSWAGDNDNHIVDEDVIFESELLGNIYENPELLNSINNK